MHFLGPTLSLSQKILNAPHFQSQPISSRYEAYFYQNDITDSLKTLEQEPITQSQKNIESVVRTNFR
ncbi:hypothetical protein [Holzapfeliella floricola]|uniref:hypothetical protein n=1 Tax=Holzapfeliella floricola TaxID=679249 RepID=UPI00078092F8|nr:hypothetical protein [Holzapfeliella floricola]